jgi:hypothetical protein
MAGRYRSTAALVDKDVMPITPAELAAARETLARLKVGL